MPVKVVEVNCTGDRKQLSLDWRTAAAGAMSRGYTVDVKVGQAQCTGRVFCATEPDTCATEPEFNTRCMELEREGWKVSCSGSSNDGVGLSHTHTPVGGKAKRKGKAAPSSP